jgi:hypothetical protein
MCVLTEESSDWFAVHLAPLREPARAAFDVSLNEPVACERNWGLSEGPCGRKNCYAVQKRQLSRKEIRAAGLPAHLPEDNPRR